jgi:hypothetical protein
VPEERVCHVPYTTCRVEQQECVRQVPTTVCTMVPYCVKYKVCRKVPYCVPVCEPPCPPPHTSWKPRTQEWLARVAYQYRQAQDAEKAAQP